MRVTWMILGLAICNAVCLAAEGARVAVLARGRAALDETVAELHGVGSPDSIAIQVDLTLREEVDAAFADLAERWGECNVLVNAAGPVDVGIRRFDFVQCTHVANYCCNFDNSNEYVCRRTRGQYAVDLQQERNHCQPHRR